MLAVVPCSDQMASDWNCEPALAPGGWRCEGEPGTPGAGRAPPPAARAPGATSDAAPSTKPGGLSRLEQGLTWEYCGPRPARLGPLKSEPPPGPDEPLELSADAIELDQKAEVVTLEGNIQAQMGNRTLEADRIRYDRGTERLQASGDTFFAQPELRLLGTGGEFDLAKNTGSLDQVHYRLVGHNARGAAQQAELEDAQHSRYRSITYTTCPPGDNAWEIEAGELKIDRETGTGTAHHAKLRVAGIPVLYSPYLSFPVDGRRKSGLLPPSFGNNDETGLDLTVPYYFNLAPNRDLTVSTRLMSERGLMLRGDFRYLTERHRGNLLAEILPRDTKDEENTRGAVHYTDRASLGGSWSSDLNVNYVSDDRYLEDFGNNLQITSIRNLERRGDLVYADRGLYFRGRVQDFQTIDPSIPRAERPYSRLPQLLAQYSRPRIWSGLETGIGAEYDYFDHRYKVHGQRLSLSPYLSWPLRRSFGHLEPRLVLNSSSYWLTDQEAGDPSSPSYAIPSASLEGQLVFERGTDWLGTGLTQTLEPRFFYLYTPYRNQEDAPLFDSAELDFSFNNLFRENRFTGRDRIGDANQLTLALTSRGLASTSGLELYRASVGQVFYFRDRLVQIRRPTQDSNTSPIAGEVAARISEHWSGRAGLEWDPDGEDDKALKKVLQIRYQTPENRIVNASYRFNLDTQLSGPQEDTSYEDTDISFRWPVNSGLEVVGRWYYSMLHEETMEAFAGLEFGRCCWRVRAVARRYKNKPGEDLNNSILLQLELAGLGEFGQRVDRFLEQTIYGYRGID